jgi:hypothetical protein
MEKARRRYAKPTRQERQARQLEQQQEQHAAAQLAAAMAANAPNAADVRDAPERCQKGASKHPTLLPGILAIFCPHGTCLGYVG